jgi:hypothetical protein
MWIGAFANYVCRSLLGEEFLDSAGIRNGPGDDDQGRLFAAASVDGLRVKREPHPPGKNYN